MVNVPATWTIADFRDILQSLEHWDDVEREVSRGGTRRSSAERAADTLHLSPEVISRTSV